MIKKLLRFRSNKIGENNKHMLGLPTIGFGLFIALFSFSNLFAQAPGRPHVNAPDVVMSCTDECVEISAEYLEIGETNSEVYEVEEIEYAPPFPFTGGTEVNADLDDSWSEVVDLPFDFCYFGETYSSMQVGTNGLVTFNATQPVNMGGTCPWSFSNTIPSTSVFPNSIYGVYMDIHPGLESAGKINYAFFGEAPARTFVINFPDQPYFSCIDAEEYNMTSQIVIYETTNVIEVYVSRRDSGCSWNSGNALIGIQNANGTVAFTPPNRNTGDWSAEKEAWRFTPAGDDIYEFWWEDADGNVISTEDSLEVCPDSASDWYKAIIEYTSDCTGEVVREEDIVNLIIEPDFTVSLGRDTEVCAEDTYTIEAIVDPMPSEGVNYLWSTGETTPSIEVSESGTYSVEVSVDGVLGACSTSDEVVITFNEMPMIDLGPDIESCFDEEYITLDATPSNMDVNDVTFKWYHNGNEIAGATESTYTADDIGVYGVTVSAADCQSYDEMEILPGNDLVVDLGDNIKTCGGLEITLEAYTNEENVTYSWYLNDALIEGETSNTLTVETRETSSPDVYKVIIDKGGCTGEDQIEVGTYDIGNCIISEGISPDGSDGYNDNLDLEFLSDRSGIKKLQIFNRHGKIVFKKDNYVNEWKGQADNGNDLPSGTYYYVIDLDQNDPVYGTQATGWIYLNRK